MKVDNKVVSFFFNRFDFIIRLVYSKFNFIRKFVFWKIHTSNYKYLDKRFEYFKEIIEEYNTSLKNKIILELGPGNSLIMAYNFLLSGAKRVILVDKYPLNAYKNATTNKAKRQKKFFLKEIEFIKRKYSQVGVHILKNNSINKNLIRFIAKDLRDITNTDTPKVDILISNSVLEHIQNVEPVILAMSNILSDNGILIHSIDFKDHYNTNRPFLFYKYSDKIWNKYLTKVGVSYTNRLRYDDFISLFNKYGFEVVFEKKITLPLYEKKINAKFKKRKDLNIGSVLLVLKKKMKK